MYIFLEAIGLNVLRGDFCCDVDRHKEKTNPTTFAVYSFSLHRIVMNRIK